MAIDFYNAGMNAFEAGRYDEALSWLDRGASTDPRCHYALGVMYYNGRGVARDFAASTAHHVIAAEAGVVPSQTAAGFAYANALGVPEDFEKAARYLSLAAQRGDNAAKVTLAEIYALGHAGGSRSEAARLLRDVLSQGSSEEAYDIYTRYELHKI